MKRNDKVIITRKFVLPNKYQLGTQDQNIDTTGLCTHETPPFKEKIIGSMLNPNKVGDLVAMLKAFNLKVSVYEGLAL